MTSICIMLFLVGGPSHIETWDPKPKAPAEVRGPFQPIATNVPAMQISGVTSIRSTPAPPTSRPKVIYAAKITGLLSVREVV